MVEGEPKVGEGEEKMWKRRDEEKEVVEEEEKREGRWESSKREGEGVVEGRM